MRKIQLSSEASPASVYVRSSEEDRPAYPVFSSVPAQSVTVALGPLILVIDDSPTIRKIVEASLNRGGFEVKSFPDGVEAIRWLMSPEARIPTLILLDVALPKMDGYEVARFLRTKPQLNQAVIIMVSRRDGVIDRIKGHLAGAKGYITKPFRTQELLSIVEDYCTTLQG